MKMPGGDAAIVDIQKLTGYCLNSEHPRGKHNARVFATIGFTVDNAEELCAALRMAAATAMEYTPRLLDVVALLSDVPAHGLASTQSAIDLLKRPPLFVVRGVTSVYRYDLRPDGQSRQTLETHAAYQDLRSTPPIRMADDQFHALK
jgi:hypothetical protein